MFMLGIILAAGKGTRMKSEKPKVLFEICGKSMINHILGLLNNLNIKNKAVIYGYKKNLVKNNINNKVVDFYEQEKQLGTGHALMQVNLDKYDDKYVFIIPGDVPILDENRVSKFLKRAKKKGVDASILSTVVDDPHGYGRIIRKKDFIKGIVEEKDATKKQKKINEINTGVYIIKRKYINKYLNEISNNNRQNEYYLTDIFKNMIESGLKVDSFIYLEEKESIGVNYRKDLFKAHQYSKKKIIEKLLDNGVTINNPSNLILNGDLNVSGDVEFIGNVIIEGNVTIKNNCRIGPNVHLKNCTIDNNQNISYKYIEEKKKKSFIVREGE